MTGLRDAWKRHKRNIKKKYFDKNATIEQMLQIRPNEIPEVQFRQLIEYWDNEDVQVRLNRAFLHFLPIVAVYIFSFLIY